MQIFNLLATSITLFGETYDISLNGIGKIIRWLIGGVGSVGVGIILFSLLLKLIVMPFDIYQRVSMRKQNIKMKENQAKMEKLQKQYANDKEMYNKKLMEMYKANGISMFSSCLPMILSLVIFIVAINAFNAYSQYAAIENYNHMVSAYNGQLLEYTADVKAENISDANGKYTVKEDGKYIYIEVKSEAVLKEGDDPVDYENIAKKIVALPNDSNKTYLIDVDAMKANTEMKAEIEAYTAKLDENGALYTEEGACKEILIERAKTAVKEDYSNFVTKKMSFLWIKNVWQTDASYKHPVSSYSDFETAAKSEKFEVNGKKVSFNSLNTQGITDAYSKTTYNEVTEKLSAEKSQANGYYILIVLSIGTILLQQWISMRSQKEQTKYSSVDGQGASQQKMTMIIMTVMFAVFSFMYSAAFSLYMIVGNLVSLGSTVLINKVVDVVETKREEKKLQAEYDKRFPGRKRPNANDKNKKTK